MKNQQRPQPRAATDGMTLSVHSQFVTIQGEGPHAGKAAVFLRLAGCNLQCPLCDTEYTEGAYTQDVDTIARGIAEEGIPLVVITGGEPFRQNISELVKRLLDRDLVVQVETNGHLSPMGMTLATWHHRNFGVVVSPKTSHVDPTIALFAMAFKYVLVAGEQDEYGFPTSALNHPLPKGKALALPPDDYRGPVYIQPADEKNDALNGLNLDAAISLVMRMTMRGYDNFRLGVQMHKIAGLE